MIAKPQANESEKAVLGAILTDENCYFRALRILQPEDFGSELHERIFREMGKADKIDLMTISDAVGEQAGYISSLADKLPDTANVEHYALIVRDAATRRRLINWSRDLAAKTGQEANAKSVLAWAESTLGDISGRLADLEDQAAALAVDSRLERLEKLDKHGPTGIRFGYVDADKYILGMDPGDFWLLAARPGVGKTALVLNVIANCMLMNLRVLLVSLEMPTGALVDRFLSRESWVYHKKFRVGAFKTEDWTALGIAQNKIHQWNLRISDSTDVSPARVVALTKRVQAQGGVDLVVIDYLQLMETGERVDKEYAEVSRISKGLKRAAKKLNVPILAACQLNRGPEHRPDKEPSLFDLRGSGALEQDADGVVLLHPLGSVEDGQQIIKVNVAKHRNGPTGWCKLVFLPDTQRFTDYMNESYQSEEAR